MATSPVNVGSSSIDVTSIVQNLVAQKRKAADDALTAKVNTNTTQISSFGNFAASLTSLQSAMTALTDGSAFTTQKVTVGDDKILSATANASAQPGNYDINISQLASAQKTTSAAFTNSKSAVGTGALTISVGNQSLTLNLDSTNNSLENIRDAINKSSSNPGVSASIVNGTDGAHLVLTSATTGKANAFTVTSSGGDGGLAGLDFDPSKDKPTVAAQDAQFTIDGLPATSSTNTVTGAIDGVTLNLATTGDSNVTIANDPSAVSGALNSLVTAYNSFINTYQTLTKFDPTNQQVGALIGDATVTSIKSQITAIVGEQFNGNKTGPTSLSNLGVSFQTDGTLKFDPSQLSTALANNPKETQNLLSGPNGIAPTLDKLITNLTASNGILTERQNNLNTTKQDLADQETQLDTQMQAYSDQLTKQYSALDAMMTKLQGTSSFLQQQFDSLNKSN